MDHLIPKAGIVICYDMESKKDFYVTIYTINSNIEEHDLDVMPLSTIMNELLEKGYKCVVRRVNLKSRFEIYYTCLQLRNDAIRLAISSEVEQQLDKGSSYRKMQ